VIWRLAWNGPWRALDVRPRSPWFGPRSVLSTEGISAVIAIAVVAALTTLGGPSLFGAVSGLSVGALVGAALVWRWDLLEVTSNAGPPTSPAGPSVRD
jgi:hypothetical protein